MTKRIAQTNDAAASETSAKKSSAPSASKQHSKPVSVLAAARLSDNQVVLWVAVTPAGGSKDLLGIAYGYSGGGVIEDVSFTYSSKKFDGKAAGSAFADEWEQRFDEEGIVGECAIALSASEKAALDRLGETLKQWDGSPSESNFLTVAFPPGAQVSQRGDFRIHDSLDEKAVEAVSAACFNGHWPFHWKIDSEHILVDILGNELD